VLRALRAFGDRADPEAEGSKAILLPAPVVHAAAAAEGTGPRHQFSARRIEIAMSEIKPNAISIGELETWKARCARLEDLLRQWHESWQRGDEGDALDAPTRAELAAGVGGMNWRQLFYRAIDKAMLEWTWTAPGKRTTMAA